MIHKSDVLDVLVIITGVALVPLLLISIAHFEFLGYAIIDLAMAFVCFKAAEIEHKRKSRDYIKRAIRERKTNFNQI